MKVIWCVCGSHIVPAPWGSGQGRRKERSSTVVFQQHENMDFVEEQARCTWAVPSAWSCSASPARPPHWLPMPWQPFPSATHSFIQHISTGTRGDSAPFPVRMWDPQQFHLWEHEGCAKQTASDVSALRAHNSLRPARFMDEYRVQGNKSTLP